MLEGWSESGNFGATGNRTQATESTGRTLNWNYDNIYRLTKETIASDPAGKDGYVSYALDPVGNRTSATSTLSGIDPISTSYNPDDEASTETYDSNGNALTAAGNSFAYDSENHLTSVNSGAVTLVYDGDGNRVAKTTSSGTTMYLVDDMNPTGYPQVTDEIVGGVVKREYTYGLQRISENQNPTGAWTPSFYGYDGAGSVRYLTSTTGAVTDTYGYDAFGNEVDHTGTTPNNYLYRGEQWDPDLGLYYLRARYMNPLTGRFLSRDPEDGDPASPVSLHKYVYAGADPVNLVDPSGREVAVGTAKLTITVSAPAVINVLGVTASAIVCDYIWERSTTTAQTQAELTNGYVVTAAPCLSRAVPGTRTLPVLPPIPFVWMWPPPQPPKCDNGWHNHHLLPQNQKMKKWFKERDLDVDSPEFTVCVPAKCHIGSGSLHGIQDGVPGSDWVGQWRQYIRQNPDASTQAVLNQLYQMEGAFAELLNCTE